MDSTAILSYERTNCVIRDKINDICTSASSENTSGNFRVGKAPPTVPWNRTFIRQAFLKDKRKLKRDFPPDADATADAIVPRIYAYVHVTDRITSHADRRTRTKVMLRFSIIMSRDNIARVQEAIFPFSKLYRRSIFSTLKSST